MLDRLKSFLGTLPGKRSASEAETDDPRVAAAVLLMMIADADGERVQEERAMLRRAIAETYALTSEQADRIVASAEAARNEAIDLFAFTSVLNRVLDEAGRIEFVGLLWDMVYADGEMNEIEDNLVWRVAELIGVSGRDRVIMRRRVREAAGLGGD